MGRRPDDRKHRLLKDCNATIVDCKGVSHTGEWTTSELHQMHDNVSFYLGKHNLPLNQLLQADRKHKLLKECKATIMDCIGICHTGEWTTSELY